MSESNVGHRVTVKDRNTLDDAQIKVRDKICLDDMEQHSEENKLLELEEENEEQEGRSWVTDSEQVLKLHVTIVKYGENF